MERFWSVCPRVKSNQTFKGALRNVQESRLFTFCRFILRVLFSLLVCLEASIFFFFRLVEYWARYVYLFCFSLGILYFIFIFLFYSPGAGHCGKDVDEAIFSTAAELWDEPQRKPLYEPSIR